MSGLFVRPCLPLALMSSAGLGSRHGKQTLTRHMRQHLACRACRQVRDGRQILKGRRGPAPRPHASRSFLSASAPADGSSVALMLCVSEVSTESSWKYDTIIPSSQW